MNIRVRTLFFIVAVVVVLVSRFRVWQDPYYLQEFLQSFVLAESLYQIVWRGRVRFREYRKNISRAILVSPPRFVGKRLGSLQAMCPVAAHSWKPRSKVRERAVLRPLIDGKDFFAAATELISTADSTVFMSYWMLCPSVCAGRTRGDGVGTRRSQERSREGAASIREGQGGDPAELFTQSVRDLLKGAATRGVDVRILLWDEPPVMKNSSAEVCRELRALHENIHVVRHGPEAIEFDRVDVSHHQKFLVADARSAIIGGLDLAFGRWDTREHALTDPCQTLWHGPDFYNPSCGEGPVACATADSEYVDRQTKPRMPWHDVSVLVKGQLALDAAKHFARRWNHHIGKSDMPFSPVNTAAAVFGVDSFPGWGRQLDSQESYKRISVKTKLPTQVQSTLSLDKYNASFATPSTPELLGSCRAQLVCSTSPWSYGESGVDCSILGAYCSMIARAEHFVYFENQFFITKNSAEDKRPVLNVLGTVLMDKLCSMIKARRVFRVVLVITHPEEQGEDGNTILRSQLETMSRGEDSIMELLKAKFPTVDLSQYIHWGFLRNYAFLAGKAVTEKIFVHSKVLIVDDMYALVASANVNDRSLLGWRDSELGVWYTDTESVGSPALKTARVSVHELRVRLWEEHLGLPCSAKSVESPVANPCDDSVFCGIWLKTARTNTEAYERVFPGVPSDRIETLSQLERQSKLPPCEEHYGLLDSVRGHITNHPLQFLAKESSLGRVLPFGNSVWT